MTRTILIADDEEFIVDLLATLLEDEHYRVLRAYDGEEALRTAERERPHLIITDVMMPKMTGTDLVRHIRSGESAQPQTPIILMSAVRQPPSPFDTHYLAKPFDIDRVLALVEQLIG